MRLRRLNVHQDEKNIEIQVAKGQFNRITTAHNVHHLEINIFSAT